MTLIIGIFFRDEHDNKEIIFASDGLEIKYKNNVKIEQNEDVEKIRKLTPKICMGYAGKNAELFYDVYNELKNNTPKSVKKELESFTEKLQDAIFEMLKTKKHRKIEEELKRSKQLYQIFIVGGVFQGKLMLVRTNAADNYNISKDEVASAFPEYAFDVVGSTDEIQKKTKDILEKRLEDRWDFDDVEDIIKYTVSEIAERYPDTINNRVFIRRLSNRFDLMK